jgi:DNA polymerase-1
VDALLPLINPYTGRLHTSYNQTVAATGRLSSSDPNLQNIPIRTELGRQIRKAFIPAEPDHVILDADYSQIELRIMAHLSGDPNLRKTFERDLDVHAATAAQILDIPLAAINQDHRRKAKEINFGIMYGMGKYGLSARLEIPIEEAELFIQNYFQKYPKVHEFIERTIADVRKKGYVTTMMNRRRYLTEINSQNRRVREFAERTAINTPIQGTAADLIKVAMIRIHNELQRRKLKSMMIMQVHDELVFEVPDAEIDAMKKLVKHEMESALDLSVPVRVDVGIGKNWLDAH